MRVPTGCRKKICSGQFNRDSGGCDFMWCLMVWFVWELYKRYRTDVDVLEIKIQF